MAPQFSRLERLPVTQEVTGPNPVGVAILCSTSVQWIAPLPSKQKVRVRVPCTSPLNISATIAQQVVQHHGKVQVSGSNPDSSSTIWCLGQAVKTLAFHAGNTGSSPVGITIISSKGTSTTHHLITIKIVNLKWGIVKEIYFLLQFLVEQSLHV